MNDKELTFELVDAFTIGTETSRVRVVPPGNAKVAIDYSVPVANYRPGTVQIVIETEYVVKITSDSKENPDSDGVIATLRNRVVVALQSSREITQEDADSGVLNAATMRANFAAHPYHRQGLASMLAMLGLPPYPLPPTFEIVRKAIENTQKETELVSSRN